MKIKVFSLVVTLLMLVSLFACDVEYNNDIKTDAPASEESSQIKSEDSTEESSEESSEAESDAYTPDKVEVKAYLAELLGGYFVSPYSYIPETMLPSYESRLVDANSVKTDYSSFVGVSDIQKMGMGEQWNMISQNLTQSQIFFTVLSSVETITTTSVVVFNNYIDSNPAFTAEYTFVEGIYTVTIKCDADTIYYVLDYASVIPGLGEQAVQIAMSMDLDSKVKTVRVQLTDLYVLAYTVEDNGYSFAIKYGYDGEIEGVEVTGVRSASFQIARNKDGVVEGKIYEYITAGAGGIREDVSSAAAEFYISDKYVTAVGNKADGMLAFRGYICELYNVESGELIAYEVKETLSGIEYNTLWFDLNDIAGISSIKYTPKTDDAKEMFFVNGSDNAWETKNVSVRDWSRRFDIEFRKQYYCYYDAEQEAYVSVAVDVPMLFVQEEVYKDLADDVKKTNGIDILVTANSEDLAKLLGDYDELIGEFADGENKVSSSDISGIIGGKVTFD